MDIPKQKLAVAVMVINPENKLLLVKAHGRGWEFPGGYVETGEPIKEAAIREVKEESGIEIELTRLCGIEQDLARSTCVFLFQGKPVSGELACSYEHLDVGYFSVEEAMRNIKLQVFKQRVIRCLQQDSQPFVIEL
ncbi:NUDIX hydrolase [Brevibacillus sp. B_LB10_24]|uniref:NUDIX hydrolase n=1 Tax=Brevibacillus sp. B_LB10_24 TaxID=3380645 RepID=UPI0038BC0E68